MPRLDEKTKSQILDLAFPTDGQQPLNAANILVQLGQENARLGEEKYVITTDRSIQKFIRKTKEQETESMKLNRQPWSMQLNENAGIPFDPILLQLLKVWFQRQLERGQGRPFVSFPVGIAKWAIRLHKMAPFLSEKELLYRARQYFAMERMAVLADKLPDSSFDDLEIAMKNETNEELKTAYKEFYGSKVIELEGQEVQTESGKVSMIIPAENVAERIVTKSKKRKKSKQKERRNKI